MNRLWFLLPLCLVYGLRSSSAGPLLDPSSLWPFGFALIALGIFSPLAWWVFHLDPDARRMSLVRLGFGSIGGVLTVYFIYGLAPGLAAKLYGAPAGIGIGVIRAASFFQNFEQIPLWLAVVCYTVSVGLVEEGSKAIAARPESFNPVQVRAAMGFMAGIGFGVAEAILYSYRQYAGTSDWTIYFGRYVFCVGFHGVMSSVAVLLLPEDWWDFDRLWVSVLRLLPIAFLHGAYDAFLQRGLTGWAWCAAVATFVILPLILWWQQEQLGEV